MTEPEPCRRGYRCVWGREAGTTTTCAMPICQVEETVDGYRDNMTGDFTPKAAQTGVEEPETNHTCKYCGTCDHTVYVKTNVCLNCALLRGSDK